MIQKSLQRWIFFVVSLSLLGLLAALTPGTAQAGKPGGGGGGGGTSSGRFTCRASALLVDLDVLSSLIDIFAEPIIANDPEDPCVTDNDALVGVDVDGGTLAQIAADVLVADTEDTSAPIDSESIAVGVGIDLLGAVLVDAGVLESRASVDRVNGQCVLSSESSVASAFVSVNLLLFNLDLPLNLIEDHLDITIPLVGTIHFNETLGGLNPTSGPPDPNRVTQRALWIEFTNPLLDLLVGDVIVSEATADFEGGNPCSAKPPKRPPDKRRMTGGGSIGTSGVTHGFVLHCNKSRLPNNLEVNWGNGNKFKLDTLTSATCSDNPNISEGHPVAGFDTYQGTGTGHCGGNGPTATATWTFTDAGEPGQNDTATINISGGCSLSVSGNLNHGNHQAHK